MLAQASSTSRARWWVVLTGAALVLAGCSGGGDDGSEARDKKDDTASSIILPSTPPSARGLATGPALEPVGLVKASDQLDDQVGQSVQALAAEGRSGALVTDDVVVAYSVANVSGYDPKTGKTLWTAKLDMGTGTTCSLSQPETADVKTFTVLYDTDGAGCEGLATVSVADGKVLTDVDLGQLAAEDDTEQALYSADDDIVTIGKTDHLLGQVGRSEDVGMYAVDDGKPVLKAVLGTDVKSVSPAAAAPVLVVATGDDADGDSACTISGFALPAFEKSWTTRFSSVFPGRSSSDCLMSLSPHDGTWIYAEDGVRNSIAQLDATTGKVIGSVTQADGVDQEVPADQPSLYALENDQTLAVDGDLVMPQVRSIARYSMTSGKLVWRFDAAELLVDGVPDGDRYRVVVRPKSLTSDGRYVIATASGQSSVEVFALDAKTGAVVGRWPVPEKYRTGLTLDPVVVPFPGGIALTRNFVDDLGAELVGEAPGADGADVYDIGLFSWPKQR
ncbi:YncE family protein [Aeromicrobium fastidiosum]|nr:PQQ-binding-like beta-propeller repeat protein [Aeromicrobium fastidiosum]MBP2392319.1 hypothetical protein [Aeromicrobium fastidiosum]